MYPSCTLPSLSELCLEANTVYTHHRAPTSSKINIANLLSSPPLSPTSFDGHQQRTDLKVKRKRASPDQLAVLNRVFSQTYFPSTEVRRALGKQLGMSPRTVQIWFQNKRHALRNRGRQGAQESSYYYLPPISPPTSPTSDISFHQLQSQSKVSLPPLRLPSNHCCQPLHSPSSISFPSPGSVDHFHYKDF